jgi:hypothetical protein
MVRRQAVAVGMSAAITVKAMTAAAMTVAATGLLAALPSALAAATVGGEARFEIEREARRLRLTLSPDDGRIVVGGRVDSAMMVYRFRVVATDRSGTAMAMAMAGDMGEWTATVLVIDAARGAAEARALVLLTNSAADFTLPRPLGFRLQAGDSIALRLDAWSLPRGHELQLVVDYEGGAAAASRLPVSPIAVHGRELTGDVSKVARASAELEWSWTAEHDGRLLALAGLDLRRVREVTLEDSATGERLWSATLCDAEGRTVFRKVSDVLRLGVAVRQGRSYRLRATQLSASATDQPLGELLALVLAAGER